MEIAYGGHLSLNDRFGILNPLKSNDDLMTRSSASRISTVADWSRSNAPTASRPSRTKAVVRPLTYIE